MLTSILIKLAIGALGSFAVGAVKSFAPALWDKIPEIVRPLVSSILGALATGGTSLATDAAAGLASVAADAVVGAGGGALARAARDSAVTPTPLWKGGNE